MAGAQKMLTDKRVFAYTPQWGLEFVSHLYTNREARVTREDQIYKEVHGHPPEPSFFETLQEKVKDWFSGPSQGNEGGSEEEQKEQA